MSHKEDYFSTEHLKSNLKSHAIKGAGVTVFGNTTMYFIQMLGTVILARLLTPEDFGLVAMVLAIYVFFKMARNLGLIDATIQREDINHKQISSLFWVNVIFSICLTGIFMIFSPVIAWLYKEPALKLIAIIISLDFIFGGISAQHRALLKRNMQFIKFAVNENMAMLLSYSIAIYIAFLNYSYWAIVARHLSYAIIEATGAWIFCRWRPGLPATKSGIRSMIKFGINMLGNLSIRQVTENVDKILIGWRYGSESLGYYHKAYHLFLAPAQQLTVPLTGVAVATLSRINKEIDKYRQYYLNAISMIAFIGFPLSAILTLTGSDIILLLLGPQWDKAGEIFSVFGLGIGIQLLYGTNAWLHISLDKTDKWLRWTLFASIFIIIAYIAGLPFGVVGVASSYVIAIYILVLPSIKYAGKPINLKLSSVLSVTSTYYFAALISGIICWYLLNYIGTVQSIYSQLNIFIRIISASILCLTIYLILVISYYRSVQPINKFFSILKEMLPSVK